MTDNDHTPNTPHLTHFREGQARMVDVSAKATTARSARAEGWLLLPEAARNALESGQHPKGDPLNVAQLAGIHGSKRTAELILLCHPIPIASAKLELTLQDKGLHIMAEVKTTAPTGVEMEALTAVTVAALNAYDMLKAASKEIEITGIRLLSKTGGKSGDYQASHSSHTHS